MVKQTTLSTQVVDDLTALILSRQVKLGELLPSEAELCKRFDISRATVREAICVLETRGLVRRRHGIGALVADRSQEAAVSSLQLTLQYNESGIQGLLEARLGLECLIAGLAATRATDAELRALADVLEPMRRPSSTAEEYIRADLDFHLQLAQASHNSVFTILVDAVRGPLLESLRATYTVDGHTERRLLDHTRILDAVVARDAAGAQAAMREHLRHTEEVLRQLGSDAEVALARAGEPSGGR